MSGDGNCLYRAAALQTPQGEGGHVELRQVVASEVAANKPEYEGFFVREVSKPYGRKYDFYVDAVESIDAWVKGARGRDWGDGVAVCAIARALDRPVVLWRKANPDQPPSVVLPSAPWDLARLPPAIYLVLDESTSFPSARGLREHYLALVPAASAGAGAVRFFANAPSSGARPCGAPDPNDEPAESDVETPVGSGEGSGGSREEEGDAGAGAPGDAEAGGCEGRGGGGPSGGSVVKRPAGRPPASDLPSSGWPSSVFKQSSEQPAVLKRPAGTVMKRPANRPDIFTQEELDAMVEAFERGDNTQKILAQVGKGSEQIVRLKRAQWKKGESLVARAYSDTVIAKADAAKLDGRGQMHQARAAGVSQPTVSRRCGGRRTEDRAEAWAAENTKAFSVLPKPRPPLDAADFASPRARSGRGSGLGDGERQWTACASWSFCPACGLRRANTRVDRAWERKGAAAVSAKCIGGCDPGPAELEIDKANDDEKPGRRLRAYVTPRLSGDRCAGAEGPGLSERGDWPEELLCLTIDEARSLQIIDIYADCTKVRGGRAPVTNLKKTAVVKAKWRTREVAQALQSENARRAYLWLMENNRTYRAYVGQHQRALADQPGDQWPAIKTAELLLRMPGVEVAARPWLYPREAFGDSDLYTRLVARGHVRPNQKPSLKAGFMRKVLSRCVSYEEDFALLCLLHDIAMAKQISGAVAMAARNNVAPEETTTHMQAFEGFWRKETEKLEDICRQHKTNARSGLPNLFFTIAPAEWKFVLNAGMQEWRRRTNTLSDGQAVTTLHMYNAIGAILQDTFLRRGQRAKGDPLFDAGVDEVHEWSLRWEYQGRGTLHAHVVAWVTYSEARVGFGGPQSLSGKSSDRPADKSLLVQYLEGLFNASVDVQCGGGSACLLRYVAGYVSKASDALAFKSKEWQGQSTWRQTYRLLCKRAPLQPEMAIEFAGLPLMKASFRGETIYAPIPGSQAKNSSRDQYAGFLKRAACVDSLLGEKQCFLEWAREHKVIQLRKTTDATRSGLREGAVAAAMSRRGRSAEQHGPRAFASVLSFGCPRHTSPTAAIASPSS